MLRFIVGRAGSGKTEQCLREIAGEIKKHPQKNFFYLVPEQGSFYAEKNLLQYLQSPGVICAQVLSFRRLAWRVLQETGGGIIPPIENIGKIFILKHILTINRDKFKFFARVIEKPGFLEELVKTLVEMKNYCLSPEQLATCLPGEKDGLSPDLADKLTEFIFIYREFEKYIEQEYLDTSDCLQRLTERIYQVDFFKESQVWIDGFHGFTPLELSVIRELMVYCPQINITLCLDEKHLGQQLAETHLFFKPWETYQQLLTIAAEIHCPSAKTFVLPSPRQRRFRENETLAYLEESFCQTKTVFKDKAVGLQFRVAANHREEVEKAAQGIVDLCRQKGLRYRDIAVLIRDFTHYGDLITNIFGDYKIPFFLDQKKVIYHHPLSDLIKGVLEVVRSGWGYEALFRCLKTDLVPLSRRETDLLENYCLAHGIRGYHWTENHPWQDKSSLGINQTREKVVNLFLPVYEKLQNAVQGKEYCEILFYFLEKMKVAQKLAYWSNLAQEKGELEEARIHKQVWQKTLDLFDHFVAVLGEQEMCFAEFYAVFLGGLETLELSLIPPSLDQVLVGSVDRSRPSNLQAVIILGVNEGIFPAQITDESIFNDRDRLALVEKKIILAPTTQKRLYAEQFLIYRTLTLAGYSLTLSCALADEDGKALTPSSFWTRLAKLFPQVNFLLDSGGEKTAIIFPGAAFGSLVTSLRQAKEGKDISPLWWEVYNWYLGRHEWQERLQKIIGGIFYRRNTEKLPHTLVQELYGRDLQVSVSRLEKFRACPFSHFLAYGLQLQERAEYKVAAIDLGYFFHAGLNGFHDYLRENNLVCAELSFAELEKIVFQLVTDLGSQVQNKVFFSTARYSYLIRKLRRILLRAVVVIQEHEKRGVFRPWGTEISFGENGDLPGLDFVLAEGTRIKLCGRIDRLDLASHGDQCYVRIVDYKSGQFSLDLAEVFYGLKLQLLTYLTVVLKQAHHIVNGAVKPAGVFYFPVKDPLLVTTGPTNETKIQQGILRELKMRGYLLGNPDVVQLMDETINGYSDVLPVALNKKGEFYRNVKNIWTEEEYRALGDYLENLLQQIGGEIMSGETAIQPYHYRGNTPCSYCPYAAVCGFDLLIPDYRYRYLELKQPEEIWAKIKEIRSE